jgi:lysophospholipase L1-like esterase
VDEARTIHVDSRTDYLLADDLPEGEHVLELVRISGSWDGTIDFGGLLLDNPELCEPPPRPGRRIEFYGDSITEGSRMPDQPTTNAFLGYAVQTARLLDAEPSLIAQGGLGLVRGFVTPRTLPSLADRVLPGDSKSKWDFTQWQPHVVVVNIGQNDKWTWGKREPEEWIAAYVDFLKVTRDRYPEAFLVAALGSMDASEEGNPWPNYLEEAVSRHQAASSDQRITTHLFPFINEKRHPNAEEAKQMAESLASLLEGLPNVLPPKKTGL